MARNGWRVIAVALMLLAAGAGQMAAQVVVFWEDRFPGAGAVSVESLREGLPGARLADMEGLPEALSDPATKLLVMPFGASFPVKHWGVIRSFLQRGGNLLTLGGKPFTRPVYGAYEGLVMEPQTYAYARELFLSDYQGAGASAGLTEVTNHDELEADLPALDWSEAYSVVIRLSDEASSTRVGASGMPDSDLRTLLWGIKAGRKVAAPVVEIDHFKNNFVGSRWVMVNCDPVTGSSISARLVARLAAVAEAGASEMRVTPTYPLYLAGETAAVKLDWSSTRPVVGAVSVEVEVRREGAQESDKVFALDAAQFPVHKELALGSTFAPGFHNVVATLKCGETRCGVARTGFWVRDEAYLLSGPKVSVDHDFFQVNGRQLPVVGTTYMDSKAQRLFFRYGNPFIWDEDMRQMHEAGLNMLRTGLWTDWDVATDNGVANEHALRTIEAFLMTARRYELPVQFNLFAFMPEVFGGGNPYLDAEAVRREQAFVRSMVERFRAVPFLIWDLMNEPGFDNPKRFFGTKPNGDATESAVWNQWLLRRYGSLEAVAAMWKTDLPPGPIPVPDEADFYGGSGGRVLSVYDFNLFTQEKFAEWVAGMRKVIRDTGSIQLMTVGTDEGGGLGSVSPAFFAKDVDFTTMHSWWLYDDLLWDSLVARQSDKPMLVQETGVMFEADLEGRPRRTLDNEAALLERKVGMALGTGAGAIEWLWNINALMQSQQEVTIGAIRWDGTEKPEAEVLKNFAKFAAAGRDHFRDPEAESVVILTSQALQYSPMSSMATTAQQRAVRVMNYQCRMPARVVAENNVADIAGSKLVVLPSPQALSERSWKALLNYVDGGGNLLITGPVERDEHWQRTRRLAEIGVDAEAGALNFRGSEIDLGGDTVEVAFGIDAQKHAEALRMANGRSYVEVKRGSGRIFLVTTPVELAESPEATEAVYRHVLASAGIETPFKIIKTSAAVLIRPRFFADSTLYLLVSESSQDEKLEIVDQRSGATLKVNLPAQRTKLMLVEKSSGRVIASYDGPALTM